MREGWVLVAQGPTEGPDLARAAVTLLARLHEAVAAARRAHQALRVRDIGEARAASLAEEGAQLTAAAGAEYARKRMPGDTGKRTSVCGKCPKPGALPLPRLDWPQSPEVRGPCPPGRTGRREAASATPRAAQQVQTRNQHPKVEVPRLGCAQRPRPPGGCRLGASDAETSGRSKGGPCGRQPYPTEFEAQAKTRGPRSPHAQPRTHPVAAAMTQPPGSRAASSQQPSAS